MADRSRATRGNHCYARMEILGIGLGVFLGWGAYSAFMGSSAAGFAVGVCSEKIALANDCVEALHGLTDVEDERLSVLLTGGEWELFTAELKRARYKMDEARKQYLSHLQAHGC